MSQPSKTQVGTAQIKAAQINAAQVRSLSFLPGMELCVIGLLSTVTLQLFRAPTSLWHPALWLESIFFLGAPLVALLIASYRFNLVPDKKQKRSAWLQIGAILFAGITILVQYLSRACGLGDATEIVMLMLLQYVAWYLITFSAFVSSFKKVGFIACCALVLFICFMSQQPDVFVASFFFAVCALWHLLSSYWNRLESKALDGQSRMLPVSGIALAISLVVILGIATIVWAVVPKGMTTSLSGFSPFSGGERGYEDLFARSGIGDGNRLTAGENATTTGPVESDQFIEDDKPSIYDVNIERYEAATEIKKQRNRAVSLQVNAKHLEEVIQSEQSGKSFRTSRKRPSSQELKLENRISKALFFAEGSMPVRFSTDCFHHFDGWDWSKVDLENDHLPRTKIRLSNQFGKPWYRLAFPKRNYLTAKRAHRVKILRLSTNSLPEPSMLRAWHIDQVSDPSLFRLNKQGTICMDGEFIPAHTIIDNVSEVPNFQLLAERKDCLMLKDSANVSGATESPFGQIPENETTSRIQQLAYDWTKGHSKGWRQVDAIVSRLRNDFKHDPALVALETAPDSVASFLDQQGGPNYQFASAATQILRAAGYKTRLKRGFLVQAKDYDRVAGQSVVTSDNMHMWPEVCIDGWHWIPVEPTPGFPIPYNDLTWWQWLESQVGYCIYLTKQHPVVSLLGVLLTGLLCRFRWELVAGSSWLAWWIVFQVFPSKRLKVTRKLIDTRYWAAGAPRPAFIAISDWLSRTDSEAAKGFCKFWQVDNFSSSPTPPMRWRNVADACRQIVSELSYQRIKTQIKQSQAQ